MKSYKWWANWPSFSLNIDHRSQRHISWMKATLSHSSILSSSFFLTLLYFYSQNQQLFSSHSVFREVKLFIYFYSHKSLHQKTKMLISYRLRWVWHIWVILSMRGKPNSANLPFPNHVEGFANLTIKQQTPIFPLDNDFVNISNPLSYLWTFSSFSCFSFKISLIQWYLTSICFDCAGKVEFLPRCIAL